MLYKMRGFFYTVELAKSSMGICCAQSQIQEMLTLSSTSHARTAHAPSPLSAEASSTSKLPWRSQRTEEDLVWVWASGIKEKQQDKQRRQVLCNMGLV